MPGEETYCKANAPCKPCPMTPGSDCSRCDNNKPEECAENPGLPHCGKPAFPPLLPSAQGCDHFHAIRDVLRVPAELPPGEYVLGWRYDCEATAQVWSNCAVRQHCGPVNRSSLDPGSKALTDMYVRLRALGHYTRATRAAGTNAHTHWRSILPLREGEVRRQFYCGCIAGRLRKGVWPGASQVIYKPPN